MFVDELTEQDLLLESHLDQALTADEEAVVEARLQVEPELAEELAELRQERNVRQLVWRQMEPTALQGERFNQNLQERIAARDPWMRRVRGLRWAGAVAACLLIGFMSGYVNRGTLFGPEEAVNSSGNSSPVQMVSDTPTGHKGYRVSLVDESGQVVATQVFDTLEQAQEFANDVGRWQATRRQAQDGHVQMVADEF